MTDSKIISFIGLLNQKICCVQKDVNDLQLSSGVLGVTGTSNRITSTGGANPVIDISEAYVGQTSITTLGTIATGVWQGTSIGTGFTDAKVTAVSGTTNRVSVTGTTAPVIDISSSYVGQASITTLGTISTGVWSGTLIAASKGGTGVANSGTLTYGSNNITLTTSGTTSVTLPTSGTLTTVAATNIIDVFLIDGQSNAQGHGSSGSSPVPVSGTVLQYYLGVISNAVDPVGDAITGSAWPSFGIRYYNTTGKKICFVPASETGSSMSPGGQAVGKRWDTGGTLYATSVTRMTNALAALTAAGYTPRFAGILWVQGERDANDINLGSVGTTAATYKSDFTTMLANYRTAFSNAHLPMYIVKTGTDTGTSDVGFAAIRTAQEELAATLTNVYIIYRGALDFSARSLLVDTVHYNQTALNEVGEFGAEAVLNRYSEMGIKIKPTLSTVPGLLFDYEGTLLSTPRKGAMEAITDDLYYTGSVGTRHKVALLTSNLLPTTLGGTGVNNSSTITLGGNLTHAGAFTQTFTATANTSLTLPSSGTLAIVPTSASVSGSDVTTTSSTSITGLSLAVAANKKYRINGVLWTGCSGIGGVQISIDGPSGSAILSGVATGSSNGVAATQVVKFITMGTLTTSGVAFNRYSGATGMLTICCYITTSSTAGNITMTMASATGGQTSTIFIGSTIDLVEVL